MVKLKILPHHYFGAYPVINKNSNKSDKPHPLRGLEMKETQHPISGIHSLQDLHFFTSGHHQPKERPRQEIKCQCPPSPNEFITFNKKPLLTSRSRDLNFFPETSLSIIHSLPTTGSKNNSENDGKSTHRGRGLELNSWPFFNEYVSVAPSDEIEIYSLFSA